MNTQTNPAREPAAQVTVNSVAATAVKAASNSKTRSRTFTISATNTLRLGYRVKSNWAEAPELFTGYKASQDEYHTALQHAEEAHEKTKSVRERNRAEIKMQREILKERIAKLRVGVQRREQTLKEELITVVELERSALIRLSKLAQGARYFAKSRALSDDKLENDGLGRRL